MTAADLILASIIEWAKNEEPIRALLLEGSRAANAPCDELADLDIDVFTRTYEPYTQDDRWLSSIGQVWVYSPDQYEWGNEIVPTRLVIFRDGVKVDFSFVGAHRLAALADTDDLDAGYRVLLDKDGEASKLRRPTFSKKPAPPPTEKDFVCLVSEYWFEAYHVAKYLKRGDLWLAKSRDWETKAYLLTMIEWHAQARHQWNYDTLYAGKHMGAWADEKVWQALHGAFAHFDRDDSWSSLLASNDLFRELATEVAESLRCAYPTDIDRNITGFILKLKG